MQFSFGWIIKEAQGLIMKVGLGQITCKPGCIEENIQTLINTILRAADQGCSVVVLPEVADVGYAMSKMPKVAGSWDCGAFNAIREIACQTRLHVICGLSERVGNNIFNSLAVIDGRGQLITKYRKIHLIDAGTIQESLRFQAGEELVIVSIGDLMWGLMICYDLRFPELARALMCRGADIFVYSSAWPKARISHWEAMTIGRAVESQVYVLGANRVGTEENITFGGCSVAVDPSGVVLAKAGSDEEVLITADISKTRIGTVRNEVPMRSAMRPDLYTKFARQEQNE